VDGQYIQNTGDLSLRRSPFLYILPSYVTYKEPFAIAYLQWEYERYFGRSFLESRYPENFCL